MGLRDLFSSEARATGRLQRHIKRAKNKNAQSPDRFAALEALRADGSPEAIEGMLGRFPMVYDKSIEDEQEKEWVFDEVKKMGPRAIKPLHQHLRNAETLSWGLRLLGHVADRDTCWPILTDLLERNDNSYARDPTKKIQLLGFLMEQEDPRAAPAFLPYLEDMNEEVRFTAVEGLVKLAQPEVAREPLLELLLNAKEESRRIKIRILDGFADLGWDVKGHSGEVEKVLPELLPGSRLDNHSKIKRKG